MLFQIKTKSIHILQPYFFLPNGSHFKNRRILQQHSYQALNIHYCQRLFNCINKDDSDCKVLQILHKPEQRIKMLQDLPKRWQQLQQLNQQNQSNAELLTQLNYNDELEQLLCSLANKVYFQPQETFPSTNNTLNILSKQQLLCLLHASCIYHIFVQQENPHYAELFFLNLEHAKECMQLAENAIESLQIFTSALIRSISLISIRHTLDLRKEKMTDASAISIAQLLPKLDYWFAKDLGLNDNIQGNLRGKFLLDQRSSGSQILRDGEYRYTAKQLYRLNHISLNNLNFLLERRKQRQTPAVKNLPLAH
jgi:hypothetical protein